MASPLSSASHHKSTLWDAPYVGAELLHFRDLDHVLRGLSKRICAEINCLEQNGGGTAMTRYDISTRSRSIGDLVALLKEHPQGIEISDGESVSSVLLPEETYRAIEGLAWLASDPERYNSVVDMHLKVQSFEENAHLFSDTFPPMKRGSRS